LPEGPNQLSQANTDVELKSNSALMLLCICVKN